MAEKKNNPQIRLSGFDSAWITAKLGDVAKRVTRKNSNTASKLPLTISAQHGLVDQITFFNSQIASQNINSYYLLMNGEFAYNKSTSQDYPVGAVKRLDRYDMGVLSTLYILFKPTDAISSDYLVMYFDSGYWHKEIKLRAAEGARNHGLLNISPDDFLDIDINLPKDIDEQQSIGAFLRNFDLLISQKRAKLEKLQALKSSMLETMFPKDGADVPEVRFNGFTEAWKCRKLGECFTEREERSADGELISVTINGGIKKFEELGKHDNSSQDKSHYKCVKIEDIAYNSMRMWQGASGYSPYNGILSPAYTVIIPNAGIDSKFFAHIFKTPNMIRMFRLRSQGITSDTWNLKFPAFSKIKVLTPKKEEQEIIAEFFDMLNRIITLHQQQLDKLKSIKKALLEKMFV